MDLSLDDIRKKETRNLVRVGNSVALILHKDERKKLGRIGEGDPVTVLVTREQELVVTAEEEDTAW